MTALIPGWQFDVAVLFGLVVGAGLLAGSVELALRATRGVTLRRLFRDWAQTGRRQ